MQSNNDNNFKIIPPNVLLAVAGIGVLVALGVAFTQRQFSLLGFGGIGVTLVALIAWVLQDPRQAREILRGRAFTYGGTAVLVTGVFIVALILLYVVIRQQGWSADLTQAQNFSLTNQARDILTTLGADPTTPRVEVVAFYGFAQADARDRASLLLDDMVSASNGKLSYRFIDPDREPLVMQQYEASPNTVVVVPLKEDGSLDLERAKRQTFLEQTTLVNDIIAASAQGDFRAFFLSLEGGIDIDDAGPFGAQVFVQELRDRYNWTVESITLLDLAKADNALQRAQAEADGSVLIIGGGATALPDEQVKLITDYLDAGGALAIFAAQNLEGQSALANADNLGNYLLENYGVRVNNDIVIDLNNSIQGSLFQVLVGGFGAHGTVSAYDNTRDGLWFSAPQSLTTNEEAPPTGVNITPLASTSAESYSKVGLTLGEEQSNNAYQRAEGDTAGPFVVAALSERPLTGARLALFGSDSMLYNQYRQLDSIGVRNADFARRVLFWASNYEGYAATLAALPPAPAVQSSPVIGDDIALLNIRNMSVLFLPFGVLALGVAVWWSRRERRDAA